LELLSVVPTNPEWCSYLAEELGLYTFLNPTKLSHVFMLVSGTTLIPLVHSWNTWRGQHFWHSQTTSE
jgi:hypothetical protein